MIRRRPSHISSEPVKQLINICLQDARLQKKLFREYFVHSLRIHIGSQLQDKVLNMNQLQNDASKRLTDVISNFIPSLSMGKLPFTYPEILTWYKGKDLINEIGNILGFTPRAFTPILSDRVVKDPPKHLVQFLKKVSLEFDSR